LVETDFLDLLRVKTVTGDMLDVGLVPVKKADVHTRLS
jgi:hypothetical protein